MLFNANRWMHIEPPMEWHLLDDYSGESKTYNTRDCVFLRNRSCAAYTCPILLLLHDLNLHVASYETNNQRITEPELEIRQCVTGLLVIISLLYKGIW